MDGSFAKELYSESLHLSKLELDSIPTDDLQAEDGNIWDSSDDELDREGEMRRNQFHTIGYRDGVIAGKEAIAQDGFNIGFKESVLEGFNWGIVRGVTSALACLPEGLRERLIETQEKRNKFQSLYESVHSLSTTDALKLFHDDMMTKKAVEQSEHANATSETASSHCSLEKYTGVLQSLLLESPVIKSHFSK
ncbi:hypothetical protein JCGZ_24499 [Jatropha curcas]|uniref:Essential protein Yae1 N-terminal domain-containing protein n=1 Tax=Jatropha curcas TaxID=180498 RepID=A0A067L7L5_JATCU|nr:uncharacterized protein LOC105631194 isoform X2 [Jatropha curcas]XP_020533981.1 uncharacterized protein LOC105631194 isoform X2 [Jatropha curcas]KDP40500.1 hypothetical protein JCGZ_24499 [Jatropha curcas]